MNFYLIAAADKNLGIGKNGKLPWRLKTDLDFFSKTTRGNGKNAVIMGRTTWESLPPNHRPLKDRLNIVLSSNKDYSAPMALLADGLDRAIKLAEESSVEKLYVIGGAKVYEAAINHKNCGGIYLTEIETVADCDAYFPIIDSARFEKESESEVIEENGLKFKFVNYRAR